MAWPTKTDFVDGDVLTAAQVNNIGTNLNLFNPTSATSGQVPVANGSGSVAWGGVQSLTQIATGNINSTTTTISAIPQTYTNLLLFMNNVHTSGSSLNSLNIRCNGNSGTVYTTMYYGNNAGTLRALTEFGPADGDTDIRTLATTVGDTANNAVFTFVEFFNYTATARHNIRGQSAARDGTGGLQVLVFNGVFLPASTSANLAAITSISIIANTAPSTGTYTLYGVK